MTTKKERREALERMTKAKLVKTIVALDSRQTKLLNCIAELEAPPSPVANVDDWKPKLEAVNAAVQRHFMPWETSAALPMPSPLDNEPKS